MKNLLAGSLLLALSQFAGMSVASATIVVYDIAWTGFLDNTMTGTFSYDDGIAVDGFVRDRDGDLMSLSLSSTDYGMAWTWSGDAADPFNFNFIVATEMLPDSGAEGSTEAQSWNGLGVGLGLGFDTGGGGRSGLLIDGVVKEPTKSLTVTRRPAAVPEPGTLGLWSLGLLGLAFARRRRAN